MARFFHPELADHDTGEDYVQAAFPPKYLRTVGSEVRTIIDVGVHKGTKNLYEAFPDRQFILIDPQVGCESMLEDAPRHYTFVNKAVASQPGTLTLNSQGAKSGFVERTELSRRNGPADRYEVEVTTLDRVIAELNPPSPIGLKIDTEGFEIEVLNGLSTFASAVHFVICEVGIRKRFIESYKFSDLVEVLDRKGFAFFTFLNQAKRRPRFYDMLFLRPDHLFFE